MLLIYKLKHSRFFRINQQNININSDNLRCPILLSLLLFFTPPHKNQMVIFEHKMGHWILPIVILSLLVVLGAAEYQQSLKAMGFASWERPSQK